MSKPRYHLAKTDPETYSVDDLERDGTTVWDGVTNAQALINIRAMRAGDKLLIYHSMGASAIVALARIESDPRPDPKNPKSAVIDVKFLHRLDPPTTLADVKTSGLFAQFALVRQSRLSTMPCPDDFIEWLRARYPKGKV